MIREYPVDAPTLRQSTVAAMMRHYPFLSGSGTFANNRLARTLAPDCCSVVWANANRCRVLAPLDDFVGRAAYYVGELDRKVSKLCSQLIRPGDTVLDIGANLGTMTVLFARLAGHAGRVLAFEPNPRLIPLLQQSTARYSQVEIHPVALGGEEKTLELCVPSQNSGAASLVGASEARARVPVPVVPLSRILDESMVRKIRFVKMDVEGYEPEVLIGARESFARTPPDAILCELNGGTGRIEHPTLRELAALDYRFFSIRKTLIRLRLDPYELGTPLPVAHDFLALHGGPDLGEMLRALGLPAIVG
jgi:FkbM family methyltransferase